MAYNTSSEYKQVIYSGDARHKVKIWFDGNELQDADRYCEKITRIPRILPNDCSKRFSLDNFVSQEVELILHNVDTSIIQDQVEISIGTLVNNDYEYVPLGIFNIQGNPTSDNNKTTIKLRDNRVKFDFGYNAKPLMDANGGKATKKQILDDICVKACVQNDVVSFLGDEDEVGIYDNSITGTTYVSYLAEQAGKTPIITRNGHLDFIDYSNLQVHKIPLYLVEKYELGNSFKIERIVYESGIIKYQTSSDETLDTLYINTANPYIKNQEHINDIFEIINDFEIDSVTTGKILGDPAIDPYDIIEVYGYYEVLLNGNKRFVDDENTIVFRTLANHIMTYTGKITNTYDTQIGVEERKENVTINGEATYRKYAKAEYDEVNASITLMAGQIDGQNTKISQITQTVDEINAKISDITDITVSAEDTDAQVELDNVNESEPIQIKIHPIGENISYLYPSSGLFPSTNLFLKRRTVRFTRTYIEEGVTKTQIIPYELPCDLLYYDQDTYDEFYLDYDSQTCQVTKRCVYNSDGTVSPLSTEQVIPYPYPTINLGTGNYTVCVLGYDVAYIMVRLMASNIYTTQFATKVEMNSAISQTAEEINLEVSRKVGNDEVISRINQSAEAITISANKINIAGTISAINNNTSTTINGNKITTGSITASQIATNAITADKIQANAITSSKLASNSVTADKIQAGAITASKVSSDIITTTNFSAQNINADKITSGTMSANRISGGTIDANNVTINNLNADKINAGTLTSAGVFIYNGVGFLKMIWDSNHPYVSALNVASGSGGISFRSSGSRYDLGGQVGHIYGSSAGNVVIEGNTGTWIQDINIQTNYIMGCYQLSGLDNTYIRQNYSIVLKPNPYGGAYIWGTEDYNKILTVGGSPSTLSIKENVREKETNDIPNMLTKIKLYDYNYIKEINDGKEDYGYIIDYLENIDGIDKYFVFNEVERNGLKYKTINHEHLSKFLLGAVIELQKEINSLKEENNE